MPLRKFRATVQMRRNMSEVTDVTVELELEVDADSYDPAEVESALVATAVRRVDEGGVPESQWRDLGGDTFEDGVSDAIDVVTGRDIYLWEPEEQDDESEEEEEGEDRE